MNTKFFALRIGNEVYSKKSGMKIVWMTYDNQFTSIEEAIIFLNKKHQDGKIVFNDNKISGTIYRYPNGIASHKYFKIVRRTLKSI